MIDRKATEQAMKNAFPKLAYSTIDVFLMAFINDPDVTLFVTNDTAQFAITCGIAVIDREHPQERLRTPIKVSEKARDCFIEVAEPDMLRQAAERVVILFDGSTSDFIDGIDDAIKELREALGLSVPQQYASNVDTRPANCRNRLKDAGKPYPRSGCNLFGQNCIFRGCPYIKDEKK